MAKPKVFFCWTLNSGTTFYRMMNPARYMRKHLSIAMSKWSTNFQGVAEWEYRMQDPLVQRDIAFLLDNCQIVLAQKFHSDGGLAVIQAARHPSLNRPFYSDFDDNFLEINPSSPAFEQYHPGSEAVDIAMEQIKLSNGLTVSTEYLARVLENVQISPYKTATGRVYGPQQPNVWVIPNGIDFQTWDNLKVPVRAEKNKKIRIGWAGGGAHVDDLEFVAGAVENILKKFSNVEFYLLGGIPPCFKDKKKIKAISKWYPIDEYPQAIRDLDLDIAIAPLKDNEFNRCKSNLRWLEYSALKIPTVASNVEPFKCIKNGEDGLLVVEPEEWEEALAALISDEGLRRKMGQAAYARVKKEFNVEKIAYDYAEKIKLMIAGKAYVSPHAAVAAIAGRGTVN